MTILPAATNHTQPEIYEYDVAWTYFHNEAYVHYSLFRTDDFRLYANYLQHFTRLHTMLVYARIVT